MHASRLPAFGDHWIPKLHDSTQDLFSRPGTNISIFRHPWLIVQLVAFAFMYQHHIWESLFVL